MQWRTHYSPIGLDIGSGQVKMVQLKGLRQQWAVHHVAVAPLPYAEDPNAVASDEHLRECLRSLLTTGAFVGKQIVSALPCSEVDIRIVHLPLQGESQDIETLVRQEAGAYFPYSLAEAILEYLVIGEEQSDSGTRRQVIVVSTPRRHVERYLALLQEVGLHCLALEVLPLAIGRLLLQHQRLSTASPLLVVDIGCRYSTAFVLWQDVLRYSRTLPWGGTLLTQAIMKDLQLSHDKAELVKQQHGIDPQAASLPRLETGQRLNVQALPGLLWEIGRPQLEAFAHELERIVSYWGAQFRGTLIDRLCLSGGSAALQHLDRYLQQRLGIDVAIVEPLRQLGGPGHNGQASHPACPPALSTAVGLALRGIRTYG